MNPFAVLAIAILLALVPFSHQQTVSVTVSADNVCEKAEESAEAEAKISTGWIDMEKACSQKIADQIKVELAASITYFTMSSHFSGDSSYRPGLSKFFLNSALEERGHAKMLLDYYQMRGGIFSNTLIPKLTPAATNWTSAENALKAALALEEQVTTNIKTIVQTCEGTLANSGATKNDYHAVDYLTEMLDEQYKSMREISGLTNTLAKLVPQFGDFAELAFDKTLQK